MRTALLAAIATVAVGATGCGVRASQTPKQSPGPTVPSQQLHARPQAVEPVAGAVGNALPGQPEPTSVSVGPPVKGLAAPESDAEIQRQLQASGLSAGAAQATLTADGLALPPTDAPPVVQAVIEAGNQIARLPYRFGGGHGTFIDTAYDCSGSLSFVFAASGLLQTTMTSGQLMSWGDPGPGKWITVFATGGHTFMYVAGLRFDTVALAETGSRWSDRAADEPDLRNFVARHPPGL